MGQWTGACAATQGDFGAWWTLWKMQGWDGSREVKNLSGCCFYIFKFLALRIYPIVAHCWSKNSHLSLLSMIVFHKWDKRKKERDWKKITKEPDWCTFPQTHSLHWLCWSNGPHGARQIFASLSAWTKRQPPGWKVKPTQKWQTLKLAASKKRAS